MTTSAPFKFAIASTVAVGALCAGASLAEADTYVQTNLVSDIKGLASVTDPNLKNPWGVSFLPSPISSPFWVSDQGTGVSTLYPVIGATNASKAGLTVTIPTTGFGGPTGQVSNTNASSFLLSDGSSALFIFANLNGTISAWNPGLSPITSAVVQPAATTAGASFTGLAINQAHTMLYAANDAAKTIDVFNNSFMPTLPGSFMTPPSISGLGLVPFNVQDLGGNVYVTYAPPTHFLQEDASLGEGAVAEFSENGILERVVVPGGLGEPLASPWGIALAPASFGKFGGDLLVGNFSFINSGIDAFNPTTGAFLGTIPINVGAGNTAGGLWDLTFGGGGKDGSPNVLYFTDGINGEKDGLFGAIASVPEPSTWLMMAAGLGGLGLAARRRRRFQADIA